MDTVEVKLLKYAFRFRKLSWREEFNIKFEQKENRLRTVLAYALAEVSGLPINTLEDAKRVLAPVPSSIIERMFIIYKGSLDTPRLFSTMGLYRPPEPSKLAKEFAHVEKEREQVMDRVEKEMEAKFGRQELEETRAIEREMLKKSKGRGLTKATPEKQ